MQARKRIMDILEKVINERRGGIGTSRVDFLQQLLTDDNKLEKDEVTRLTDKEIKDNILTMIIAGKEY
jgi:cytochrome P450